MRSGPIPGMLAHSTRDQSAKPPAAPEDEAVDEAVDKAATGASPVATGDGTRPARSHAQRWPGRIDGNADSDADGDSDGDDDGDASGEEGPGRRRAKAAAASQPRCAPLESTTATSTMLPGGSDSRQAASAAPLPGSPQLHAHTQAEQC